MIYHPLQTHWFWKNCEFGSKFNEAMGRQGLGEIISKLLLIRCKLDLKLVLSHLFLNKVEVIFHMLGIDNEISCTNIVTEKQRRSGRRYVKFLLKILKPGKLSCTISQSTILRLCAGSRYHFLLRRNPGNEIKSQKN